MCEVGAKREKANQFCCLVQVGQKIDLARLSLLEGPDFHRLRMKVEHKCEVVGRWRGENYGGERCCALDCSGRRVEACGKRGRKSDGIVVGNDFGGAGGCGGVDALVAVLDDTENFFLEGKNIQIQFYIRKYAIYIGKSLLWVSCPCISCIHVFWFLPSEAWAVVADGKSEVETEECRGTGGGGPKSTWTRVKPGVSVALRLAFIYRPMSDFERERLGRRTGGEAEMYRKLDLLLNELAKLRWDWRKLEQD